ncbi:MAG: 3-methyl-2-oxobutanoate hydroxymethyltransferase [Pseudomonadota bacterium]
MYGNTSDRKRLTVPDLVAMKRDGERIAMMTAYDASFADALDAAGMDAILVGDSLGMVVQGHSTTLPVTMDDIVYHCSHVARGEVNPVLIGDLPFLAFRDEASALVNAGRLLAEGGMAMVKLEGGGPVVAMTARLVAAGIPVCGHLGLTPQSVHGLGGFRVQGREKAAAEALLADARALEAAGASLLVLEAIPDALAERVSGALAIPTIGIGAGAACDGQVLVLQDALGLGDGPRPRFVRDFLADGGSIRGALEAYVAAVKDGSYPAASESYG